MANLAGVNSAARPVRPAAGAQDVRFFFASDSHDGFSLLDKFVRTANQEKPAFVLSGGDMTEVGSAKEHNAVLGILDKLKVPFESIPGNHDYRGSEAPRFANAYGSAPKSFDKGGVHFVLIDNADQHIDPKTFAFLEKDLAANKGKPTVVAMHVPAVGKAVPKWLEKLHKRMPVTIAYPKLEDPAQAKQFTDLMSKYDVKLVLSGHTHVAAEQTVGGVRYVTAGALGGKLTKVGVSHEYLDVAVKEGQVDVRHVPLDAPVKNAVQLAAKDVAYFGREVHTLAGGSFTDVVKNMFGDLIDHFIH